MGGVLRTWIEEMIGRNRRWKISSSTQQIFSSDQYDLMRDDLIGERLTQSENGQRGPPRSVPKSADKIRFKLYDRKLGELHGRLAASKRRENTAQRGWQEIESRWMKFPEI
jgi:hypothetical protein